MSKESDLRAMREARYAARTAGAKPAARLSMPSTKAGNPDKAAVPATGTVDDGLCGHRSMNGRTCTREQGHSAKSHRYS